MSLEHLLKELYRGDEMNGRFCFETETNQKT